MGAKGGVEVRVIIGVIIGVINTGPQRTKLRPCISGLAIPASSSEAGAHGSCATL